MAKTKRVRRSPEEARALILAAAERVFADKGPDAAGLKDVAREAGVSHGLVTHYFGTYAGLVEAALEQNAMEIQRAIVARLASTEDADPSALIAIFFELVDTTLHGRLAAWALLSGRMSTDSFFARRNKGAKVVVDAIEARLAARFPEANVDRTELEHLVLMVLLAGMGAGLSREVLWESLGHKPTKTRQAAFRAWLSALVDERMQRLVNDG